MAPSAMILLADGFEETEAITPIDLLRRAGISLQITSLDTPEVRGAHDIVINTDILLSDVTRIPDCIILPGGQPGTTNLGRSEKVISIVQEAFKARKLCAAICAAPSVFGKAGILSGKKATCYPGVEGKLEGAEFVEESVVSDDNIITSRGVGTAIPFSLEIIKYLIDEATAQKVGEAILYR